MEKRRQITTELDTKTITLEFGYRTIKLDISNLERMTPKEKDRLLDILQKCNNTEIITSKKFPKSALSVKCSNQTRIILKKDQNMGIYSVFIVNGIWLLTHEQYNRYT